MSFFAFDNKTDLGFIGGLTKETIYKSECAICPLNRVKLCHPKMKPYGTDRPAVYMLGEAPGEQEDLQGIPFVGPSGKLLRKHVPERMFDEIRWNNTIRCRPPKIDGKQSAPLDISIEACRPELIRDIERTAPLAIFGFGNVPLGWALDQSGISVWSGRWAPVKIGTHTCWYFPFLHPAAILYEEQRDRYVNRSSPFATDMEFQFSLHMKQAFRIFDQLPEPVVHSRDEALADIDTINGSGGAGDLARMQDFLDQLATEDFVGFDYETNRLRPYGDGAKILSVAFAGKQGALGIALDHKDARWTNGQADQAFKILLRFLKNRKCRLIAHHLPFELEWTAYTFGEDLLWEPERWEDTESQAFILDERPGGLSLEFLCLQYFGLNVKAIDNLDRKNLADAPLDMVTRYNALDAKYHRLLFFAQDARLDKEGLQQVYLYQLDRAIAATAVQLRGVPVDQNVNAMLLDRYMPKLQGLEDELAVEPDVIKFERKTGRKYRPSAPQDAKKFVEVIVGKKLETSEAKALESIKHPVIKKTLAWRDVNKIASTYVLSVCAGSEKWDVPRSENVYSDNLLHPILSVNKVRTNRTSSEDPNIQNWPIRKKEGLEARKQVKPGRGRKVVALDFAGIQARNVAMESKDEALVKAFLHRYDIHTDWMERIEKACARRRVAWVPGGLKAADKDVKKAYRHRAKNQFVFPSFFGAGAKKVAEGLGISESIGYDLHDEFWGAFPDIRGWQERTIADYHKVGYVTGLSGFRRHAPVAHTELINTPIQSDEAIIVCDAMTRLGRKDMAPNMEIHDDFTYIWRVEDIERNAELVIGEMLRVTFKWINVPLGVEMSIGDDWGTKESIGEFFSDKWDGRFDDASLTKLDKILGDQR